MLLHCTTISNYGTDIIFVGTTICPELNRPPNGGVYFSKNNTKANFYCNEGFTLKGRRALACTDGKWSSSPPVCVKQ